MMRSVTFRTNRSGAAAIVLALWASGVHAASFTGLGDLPDGYTDSMALAISADGNFVVGRGESANGAEAFRWSKDTGLLEGLGDLAGADFFSEARGVSADGLVVVGTGRTDLGDEPFRWTAADGMLAIGALPGSECGYCIGVANGVSADGGAIVGYVAGLFNYEAFRWTADSGVVRLGTLPDAVQSMAEAVSADGSVVVGRTNAEAFRWTESAGMVGLGDLGGSLPFRVSEAYGISADGNVVVGGARDSADNDQAFLWTSANGMEGIGILPGAPFNAAGDASADGSVIVGIARGFFTGSDTAFVWTRAGGLRNLKDVLQNDHQLDLAGWTLVAATAVSDDGQTIAGYGFGPAGFQEAWVATLGPATGVTIAIDIGPHRATNKVKPGTPVKVTVAVLSAEDFDAATVDPDSVRFGPDGARPVQPDARAKDVNRDGLPDRVFAFRSRDTGIQCSDTQATLTASTYDGLALQGSDAIATGKCR